VTKLIYFQILAFLIASTTVVTGISSQFIVNPSPVLASTQPEPKQNITLAITYNDFNNHQGKSLFDNAINKLRSAHPNLRINVKYVETSDRNPGSRGTHDQLLNAMSNGTSIDVVTLDQIWLGEFAQKGYLTDLTKRYV